MIRKTVKHLAPAIALLLALGLLASCEDLFGAEDDAGGTTYNKATADVDYSGSGAKNQVVFFDFSTGKITEVAHDTWDIAIANSGADIIANSGDYGTGVLVYKSSSTTIADDRSADEASVTQYTFKDGTNLHGTQTTENPFENEFNASGAGSGTVYLVKDEAGTFYKVVFNSYGPMGRYDIDVVTGLNGTTVTSITGSLDGDYGYTYFDLGSGATVSVAPPKDEWDVAFARTNDRLSAGYVAGRSDVLINTEGNVQGAEVADTAINGVTDTSALTLSSDVDVLGHSWYNYDHDRDPGFEVNTVTYVVQTTEGNMAKFQPGTFYGPNDEQFYMDFRYHYQENGATTFSR